MTELTNKDTKKERRDKEWVLRYVKDHNIRYINMWFTDVVGQVKCFELTPDELEGCFDHGNGFDGSSVTGYQEIHESDLMAFPDPETFAVFPWSPDVGRLICDIKTPDGRPYIGDPRYALKRCLKKVADMGYESFFGPELEYFYFSSKTNPEFLDNGGYYAQTPEDLNIELRRKTVETLQKMGISVEYSHHEVAPSQHEIDLKYDRALKMADNTITYRLVVKQVAQMSNVYATFMPKPIFGINGSGMHVHVSLFDKLGHNAFFDKNDECLLSPLAKKFIAGVLKHSSEIILATNQTVNSYKRLVPGYEAPVYKVWARCNRSTMIRIPQFRVGMEKSTRMEFRAPDPACNPYLAFVAILAAGIKGIEGNYELPDPIEENIYAMSEEERIARGIEELPGTLKDAVDAAKEGTVLREAFGEHIFNHLIKYKQAEWDEHRIQVTEHEMKTYFSTL